MTELARPVRELDVFDCPLGGIQLIEASAGTGKTWAICGLVMRLLLERRLEIRRILVVTFTHAATAELRERIRQRIVETLAHLRGAAMTNGDLFVPRLLASLRTRHALADDDMTRQLELALAAFDEAAIFTIHGFCHRALADSPFAAQLPLQMELLHDDSELRLEAVNDFWRRRIAADGLDPALAAYLLQRNDSPPKYARTLRRHLAKPTALPKWPADLAAAHVADKQALRAAHAAARALWTEHRDAVVDCMRAGLPAMKGNIYKVDSIPESASAWDTVLRHDDAIAALEQQPKKLDLLARAKLDRSVKSGKTAPTHPFFDLAQALLDQRQALAQSLRLARLALLHDLFEEASLALRATKRQRRILSFDDLLAQLHSRLTAGDSAGALAESLRSRFPAALIDEFQDTDPLQFAIFRTLYGAGGGPLFLVGDPKQAIYGFRNADLHTYLGARAQAQAEYTLVENQRSTAPLLEALNTFFGANGRAFMLDGLDYRTVSLGAKKREALVDTSTPCAALQVWALPDDPATGSPPLKADAERAAARATAGEIARLLAAAARGEITLGGRPLGAGDIAVLVRRHKEGSLMRQALAELGVGSIELSQASVFRSPDAEDLDRLLCAVLEPGRERLLRAALATEAMGLDAAAIDSLADDEARLLDIVQRFVGYRELWVRQGVGVMLRRWLAAEQVAERMLARADGERRLTNLLHLFECLQQAAELDAAPDALLHWLQSRRLDDRPDEEAQLRLESDRHLVQVVTVHKSKGLEYPIVFCPFLWDGRLPGLPSDTDGIEYHDDEGRAVIDFCRGFDHEFDEKGVKSRLRFEAAADALRLIYVALTRAVHRCVLVAAAMR